VPSPPRGVLRLLAGGGLLAEVMSEFLLTEHIAACDTYDAIVTDRPYRAARSHREACEELSRVAGTQLDPRVVRSTIEEREAG
jgi:hypothetical protein